MAGEGFRITDRRYLKPPVVQPPRRPVAQTMCYQVLQSPRPRVGCYNAVGHEGPHRWEMCLAVREVGGYPEHELECDLLPGHEGDHSCTETWDA